MSDKDKYNQKHHGYNHSHSHGHTNHHGHNHAHHHVGNGNIGYAFLLNALFTVIEIIGGLFTNSTAILSDAIHDLGDTVSLAVSWLLDIKSNKNEDKKYTYGYSRLSVVGSMINIVVLTIGTTLVLINSIPRIINPQPVNSQGMLVLSIVGVIMNGLAVLKVRNGEKISEKVAMLHLMEDVLGWVCVLVVSIVMVFVDMPILDPILSVGISIYIIKNIILNTKTILEIILQTVPNSISIDEIKNNVKAISTEVANVKNIKCWTLDGESNVITLELEIKNVDNMSKIKQDTENALKEKYNAKYVSVSINVL